MFSNSVLSVYLCNVDNLEVPADDERYGREDPDGDVDDGVDSRLGKSGSTACMALPVLTGERADPEEGREGGGETETPEHEDEQTNPLTGQDRGVPA